jgi:hypothetical protein
MKRAVQVSFSIVLGAVLLAALHSHAREHQVPHPQAAKVSLAKRVVPRPQLSVVIRAVAVPAAEHLIAVGFVATAGAVALFETEHEGSLTARAPPSSYIA